jgi:tetratricopeptide (TPR) repeat protein
MKATSQAAGNLGKGSDEKPRCGAPDWLLALGLFLAVLLAYQPAWNGKPVWDDSAHFIKPALQSWHGLERIWFQPGATQQYYPLVYTVAWLEQKLWGDATPGRHFVNILLHLASALLLVKVLRRLEVPGAWLGAALWALHPVQAESVAWMSELKNTLSGLCYLGSALAYLRFDREKKGSFYLLSLALFGAGLLAKSVIATLPAALLLVFWWQRKKLRWKEDVLPLAPFFIVGIGLGLFTAWMERTMIIGTAEAASHLSLMDRCLILGRAVWFYLGKLAWPHPLIFVYPRWEVSGAVWWQYLFPVAALLLAAGLWHGRRRLARIFRTSARSCHTLIGRAALPRRPESGRSSSFALPDHEISRRGTGPLVALLYFVGTLFPALGFFDVYPFRYSFVADHFQYLACLGPLALAGAGIERALGWLAHRSALLQPIGCAILLTTLGALTWIQCLQYADVETLWRATLANNPGCWLAHTDLGVNLLDQGRIDEAARQLRIAVAIQPDFAESQFDLGCALIRQGAVTEAIAHFRKALDIHPDFAEAHNGLGGALIEQGNLQEAIAQFRMALALKPNYSPARENLGLALLRQGDFDGAMACLERTTALPSETVARWYSLANQLLEERHFIEAMACYRRTLSISPRFAGAWAYLGLACFQNGQTREAVESWQKSLEINPGQPQVQNNIASVLATASDPSLRNGPKAVSLAEQANQATGGADPRILCTLAAAYAETGRYDAATATAQKALLQAEAQKDDKLSRALRAEINLYDSGHPLREPK